MPYLIPEAIPASASRGEKIVFTALRDFLPAGCVAWYNLPLRGRQYLQQPDFTLLGDGFGLAILEIKDWDVRHIAQCTPDSFQVRYATGIEAQPNPILQAKRYATTLTDLLRGGRSRLLIESDGPHQGGLRFPFCFWALFPFIGRAELNAVPRLAEIMDPRYTLVREDLGPGLFARLCSQALFPARLASEQVQAVRRILYPEVCIPAPAAAQLPLLDLDQEQIAKSYLDAEIMGDGRIIVRDLTARLVRGVVGSGKSLILLYRARYLADVNESWQIAIVTFNRSLGAHLRHKALALGVPMERVRIQNFHAWARSILVEAHCWPANLLSALRVRNVVRKAQQTVLDSKAISEEFLLEEIKWMKGHRILGWDRYKSVPRIGRGVGLNNDQREVVFKVFEAYQRELSHQGAHDWEDVPLLILDGIERGQIRGSQFHAILIDEAQDFWPTWFQVTLKMLRPETNMLFLVADTAQKIYRSAFSWKELGIELRGKRVRILRRSYRNTSEILQTAYAIIRDEEFLREEDGFVSTPELNHPAAGHGPLPIILAKDNHVQELEAIVTELKSLRKIGFAYRDILLTTFRRESVGRLVRVLAASGIQAVAVDDDTGDKAKDVVTVSTLHSAKGLEYRVVFVCGLNELSKTTDEDDLAQNKRLLYVGMTRARELLYLTYHGVAPEWALARLLPVLEQLSKRPVLE